MDVVAYVFTVSLKTANNLLYLVVYKTALSCHLLSVVVAGGGYEVMWSNKRSNVRVRGRISAVSDISAISLEGGACESPFAPDADISSLNF